MNEWRKEESYGSPAQVWPKSISAPLLSLAPGAVREADGWMHVGGEWMLEGGRVERGQAGQMERERERKGG